MQYDTAEKRCYRKQRSELKRSESLGITVPNSCRIRNRCRFFPSNKTLREPVRRPFNTNCGARTISGDPGLGAGRFRFNTATSRIANIIGGTAQKNSISPQWNVGDRSMCTSEEVASLVEFFCTGDGNACLSLVQKKAAPDAESHDFRVRHGRHLSVHESFRLLFHRQ